MATAACGPKHLENPAVEVSVPGLNGSTNISYYDIHGRTAQELVMEMRQLGPKSAAGAFFGETLSPMHWEWRSKSYGGSCELTNLQVHVVSNMTLPRWTPPADTVPGLAEQWRTFLAALETHEIGHQDISARGARDVERALQRYTGNCATLASDVRRVTDPIMERVRVEQIQYDATTRHGMTQGATFPPRRVPIAPPPKL
jgi:predicted secreted Zn-dependent protease